MAGGGLLNLIQTILSKRIIVCCGSGGVGKTTTAAAVALEAARRGKKAVVLTIDPAKRLATALGLSALTDDPRVVPAPGLEGELSAMMLDTKRTFDRLIERYAPSDHAARTILDNRLYKHLSNMMAGSQEYMAMEKLYEMDQGHAYDLMVLDTPPTRHALDFLEAPQKMIQITSNSILRWFLMPGLFAGRIGVGALRKGAEKILAVFDKLAGMKFLTDLSEMLTLISGLLGGFQKRAESVYDLLRQDSVGFLLITSPSPVSIQDALYFHRRIEDGNLPFVGFLVNRVLNDLDDPSPKRLAGLSPALREKIWETVRQHQLLARRDLNSIRLLKKMGGKKTPVVSVPTFATDIHDLEGLLGLNKYLFGS